MKKITLEKYFDISIFLNTASEAEYTQYRKECHKNKYTFDENKKVAEIVRFYDMKNSDNHENPIAKNLFQIKSGLFIAVFLITAILYALSFKDAINMKIYILFSFIVPLLYSFWGLFSVLRYKFPSKEENSFLKKILSFRKLFTQQKSYETVHSHVFKTMSTEIFVGMGVMYALGVLATTVVIFWAFSINFYSESTFESATYVPETLSCATKIFYAQITLGDKSECAWFIIKLIGILFVIKLVILFFAQKNLQKTILISLKNQGEKFFDVIFKSVEIKQNNPNANTATGSTMLEQETNEKAKTPALDYYVLYYNMNLNEKEKIVFDFANTVELQGKNHQSFSYALFDKEDEDLQVQSQLANIIFMFTSAETLPDNTFKDDISYILSNGAVKEIWILPLTKMGKSYILLGEDSEMYQEWKQQVSLKIKNPKVRLYDDKK
ncbi:MAG: hypothetical protein WC141_01145 [Arcobacteraceae bacterium]